MKIIVVGSISSGMTLAERLAAGEGSAQITLYEKAAYCSCGTRGLPHYLGLAAGDLSEILAGCALSARGGRIRTGMEVTAVDPAAKTVTVRSADTGETAVEPYDKLVLATGSRGAALRADGAGRMGIHTLRRVEDLMLLREFVRTPYVRDIVVLGGSLEALEVAGAFRKLGRNVRVIDCGQGLLPGFDSEVRSAIQRELEETGIAFHLGEQVNAFRGRTFVETVVTDRGSYDCDLCVPCLGTVPNTQLLPQAKTDADGRFVVDADGQTSLTDVYAAGSCASAGQGWPATVSARLGSLEVARTGLTQETAEQLGLHPAGATASGQDRTGLVPNAGSVTVKLVYAKEGRRLLGGQVWGGADAAARANAIAVAVQAGMTVEELAKVRFVTGPSGHAAWDPIQSACAAAK